MKYIEGIYVNEKKQKTREQQTYECFNREIFITYLLKRFNQSVNQAIVFESKSVKQKIIGITFCKESDRHVFFLYEGCVKTSVKLHNFL